MTAHLNDLADSRTASGSRAILAASVGNLLEWFDFSVYASFAIYIGINFFPRGAADANLIKTFLVFGLGFVFRPIGAIAAAPSYATIGIGAPLLLVGGRVLQGFSAGGEIGNAAAFLVEHAPAGQKGRYTAWLQASMGMSNILAALVAFAITALLTESEVVSWGWRIPFAIGLLIAPVGLYLRRTLTETPSFCAEAARPRSKRAPMPVIHSVHGFRRIRTGNLDRVHRLRRIRICTRLVYRDRGPACIARDTGLEPAAGVADVHIHPLEPISARLTLAKKY